MAAGSQAGEEVREQKMSTFESFITTSGLEQDESFLSGLCSQHPKVEAFLAEYHRRAELVCVLHEQNALLKRQVDSTAAGNAQTRSSADKLVEEVGWSLGKTQNDLVLVGQECAKMREFVRVLEANNDGLKQRSADNEMLIVEAKEKNRCRTHLAIILFNLSSVLLKEYLCC